MGLVSALKARPWSDTGELFPSERHGFASLSYTGLVLQNAAR
jgi:hypothetical protein